MSRTALAAGAALAFVAPGLVTILALTSVEPVVPALGYVLAISLVAAIGGTGPALLGAAASFTPYTYFFTPPHHRWAIDGAVDAVALAAFVVVAVGMSQLVAHERRLRAREREERRRAEEAAAQTLRLEAVARALANARTPQAVLDAVLTEGLEAAEARAGVIAILSDDGRRLQVVATRGYEAGRIEPWSEFGVDERLPLAEAVRTGTSLYFATTAERDARYPDLAGRTATSHALACLPLAFEGRTIGGLTLSFPTEQVFDDARRALKEALAAQAAQALERTRLDEAERALRERLAFVAEASELLASSLDYEQTLRRLADLAVPRLADWCAIDVVADDGSIQRLAVAHRDPAKVRYARELSERYPPDPDAPRGLAHVLRSGEPEFVPEIPEELLAEIVRGDEERLAILRELGLRSAMTVPLIARGRTLGALTLIAAETVPPYAEADLRLAQDLARRAAVAVDNARLHAELEHVADAVVLVDDRGVPRYWNGVAARLLGERDGTLAAWPALGEQLAAHEWSQRTPSTLPLELDDGERWLQVSRVAFDEGRVYALRDVTDERLLERTRSEFVATASHELRTPIAAVYGVFQTLARDDVELEPGRVRQFLRIGLDESERLAHIVDDLLLAGQLDSGAPTIEPRSCDLRTIGGEVVDSAAERADGHTFATAVDSELEQIECDPLRLRQVLVNLVENAVKYSPDGGRVAVSAHRANGRVRIEVADEGIGIPAADQQRIFDRFVRLDPALNRGVGGTGLGLYICRELVSRMGGRIDVRSRVGVGSTFVVELPVSLEPMPRPGLSPRA